MRFKKINLIDLHPREILQINATVIAGALIFLTFIGNLLADAKDRTPVSIAVITMLVTIMMFSLSSVMALLGANDDAIHAMAMAFIIIIIFVLTFMIVVAIVDLATTPEQLRNLLIPANQTASNQSVTNQTIVNLSKIG